PAPLVGRHELHHRRGGHAGPARGAQLHLGAPRRSLAQVTSLLRVPDEPHLRPQADTAGDAEATARAEAAHLADEDVRDELPEDLDPSAFVGPYVFPNNSRRRVPGMLYLLIAAALVAVYFLADGSPLVNAGFLLAALLLAAFGAYSLASGWDLKVDE